MSDDTKRDEEHPAEELDYSPASGSRNTHRATADESVPTEHDGRAKTTTTFIPSSDETPLSRCDDNRFDSSHDRWQWLNKLHDGFPTAGDDSTEQEQRNRAANLRRDIAVVCQTLGVSDYQQQRALAICETIQANRDTGLNFGSEKPLEVTIVAAVRLACREDGRPLDDDISVPQPAEQPVTDSDDTVSLKAYPVILSKFIPDSVDNPDDAVKRTQQLLRESL